MPRKIVFLALVILLIGFIASFAGDDNTEINPNTTSALARNTEGLAEKAGLTAPARDEALNKEAIMAKAADLAVPFVANAGQFHKDVRFSADLFAGRFFLTNKELVYSLIRKSPMKNSRADGPRKRAEPEKTMPDQGLAFKEFFVDDKGKAIEFKSKGIDQGVTKVSYFRGNDPAKWQSGLTSFKSVSLGEVYPGIEVKLKASHKNVEKVFYVSSGNDVGRIKIGVAGVKRLKIARDGQLLFKNAIGELAMRAPVAWQEIGSRRHEIKVSYHLFNNHLYGFTPLENFDKNLPLIIDPELDTLMGSTYLGGNHYDDIRSMVLDSSGNVYLAGLTSSVDFPATSGAYNQTYNGSLYDVFVSKLNKSLTTLLSTTFLGGSNDDGCFSLAMDTSGNVYLAGDTDSLDFPVTFGSFDQTYNGGHNDAFVSKLNGNLTDLLFSTFLGGNGADYGFSLALDNSGNVYLAGLTGSIDFPTTVVAYDRKFNEGNEDVFVSKLDKNLSTLLASTYLGGSGSEEKPFLTLDGSGNIYLTGSTNSADFPITPGVYDQKYNSYSHDAFVTILNGSLNTILASTFLGGNSSDVGLSMALDITGNVYLTGRTNSTDFPITARAYDEVYNGPFCDVFIAKLNKSLTMLLASTYLGGGSFDEGNAIVLDSVGNVYLAGCTDSENFPTTPGAYDQGIDAGHDDAFAAKLNGDFTKLLASTRLGGSQADIGNLLSLDDAGNVYLTGMTFSADFPTTPEAYDQTYNGGLNDIFIAKLNGMANTITVTAPNGGESWTANTVHDIAWMSTGTIDNVRIEVSFDRGSTWSDVMFTTANTGRHSWTIPDIPSLHCLIRISDIVNAATNDINDELFFTTIGSINFIAERREVSAFSIQSQYGQIQITADTSGIPVVQYRLMRRKGKGEFELLKTFTPAEMQNGQFKMQDKYLEKDILYTYQVEARGASGELLAGSTEKTI